jgi:glycerol uptake facilitator-like aquaporin
VILIFLICGLFVAVELSLGGRQRARSHSTPYPQQPFFADRPRPPRCFIPVAPGVAAVGGGLVLIFLIYSTGAVSGAHLNPGVTWLFTLRGSLSIVWLPFYVFAQLSGGLVGAGLLRAVFGAAASVATPTLAVSGALSEEQGFWLEVLLGAILQIVVLPMSQRGGNIGRQPDRPTCRPAGLLPASVAELTHSPWPLPPLPLSLPFSVLPLSSPRRVICRPLLRQFGDDRLDVDRWEPKPRQSRRSRARLRPTHLPPPVDVHRRPFVSTFIAVPVTRLISGRLKEDDCASAQGLGQPQPDTFQRLV